MAKKKSDGAHSEIGETIKDSVKSVFSGSVLSLIKDTVVSSIEKLRDVLENAQKRALESVYIAGLTLYSVIFLTLAIVFLLSEYAGLTLGWSFFVIGLLLLCVALYMKATMTKKIKV